MRSFCTYFDSAYLSRGLALHESLTAHTSTFVLYVLCLDDEVYDYLEKCACDSLIPIALSDVERWEEGLSTARRNRSTIEYYFTLSPILPRYLIVNFNLTEITYLDADLYFYSSPERLFDEMGSSSIQIIPHRFSPNNQSRERFGIYNVQYLTFRNDDAGLHCLDRWSEQCLDWCYDRLEGDRYADQKYLDEWPALYPGLCVSNNIGAGLAPWNQSQYAIKKVAGSEWSVDGSPVIFYHFHNYVRLSKCVFSSGVGAYQFGPNKMVIKELYSEYATHLGKIENQLKETCNQRLNPQVSHRRHFSSKRWLRAILYRDIFMLESGGTDT